MTILSEKVLQVSPNSLFLYHLIGSLFHLQKDLLPEYTLAALSLCLPEATWSVLMKSSKHPACSRMFSIGSHCVGVFQDIVSD